MSITIDSIIGWDFNRRRVVAKGVDGELFSSDPTLVAQLANDPYLTGEPVTYAKRACIHAMINLADRSWRHFEIDSVLFYCDQIKTATRQKIGF